MTARATVLVVHPGAELFGSDRMALESVRGFVAAGMRVVVALPEAGPLTAELVAAGATVVHCSMLVLRKALLHPSGWPTLVRQTLRNIGCGLRLLRRVRPDAVYISTVTLPLWPLLTRLRRVPTVSHVHEAEASGNGLVNRVVYAPHLLSGTVLVNSDFSRRTIAASWRSLAARAHVVYNGVAGPDAAPRARAELDALRVLYIGRLSPRKGVADAVQAVALARHRIPATLTLLGSTFPGYEWFERELRTQAAALGNDGVRFAGFQADIWPLLAAHDVLVVPSRVDEPFGNTAVEGILAGRPVIASDASGLREAAGGYATTTLVRPAAPAALADALVDVHRDWSSLRRGLAGSAQRARDRHAPGIYRRAVADLVARAIHDPAAARDAP